ncbi:MAG: hypothetical protein KAT93_07085 [Desulfuromonadales bacterium]|nr:hypothetical protein [Desulfuromonadales bacterium]
MKKIGVVICLLMFVLAARAEAEQLENLLGLETDFDTKQIMFVVASSGCTSKGDFRVEVKDEVLTVYRLQRDACKRMPFRERIVFTLDELGLSPHKPFALGNRILVNENLMQM